MSRSIGRRLPIALKEALRHVNVVRDQTLVFATVDAMGEARFALISRAEILIFGDEGIFLALWPTSQSATNLNRTGHGSLLTIHDGAAYTIVLRRKGSILFELGDGSQLRAFECSIDEVREDRVEYASIVSVLEFELSEPAEVLPRWQELNTRLFAIAKANVATGLDLGASDG